MPTIAADEDLRAMVKQLSQQVRQLSSRVNDLESQLAQAKQSAASVSAQQAAPLPAPAKTADTKPQAESAPTTVAKPVNAGDIKGTIKIPGTDTSIAVGGYAKLDVLYNSISAGSNNFGDQYLVLSSIPVGAARAGENSQTTVHAKESRFWFKSYTPSPFGDINTYLELDLYGAADSYTARLRHAYGSLGNFLGGQTWSTFLNVAAIPETLDIGGPVGLGLVRQPLVRWTQPISFDKLPMEVQIAAESPNTRLSQQGSAAIIAPNDEQVPDLIARINANPAWGNLSMAAMGRQIRNAPAGGPDRSAWGGAVSLAGKIKTFGLDNLRFNLSYGDVLGRYATLNTFGDAVLDNTSSRLELADTFAAMVSYQHWWSPSWRSTLAYGYGETQLPAYANSGLTRQGQSVHVNLLWSPLLQVTFGLEYLFATRMLESGASGDLQRLQFSSRFSF
jgi:hypothetical protein